MVKNKLTQKLSIRFSLLLLVNGFVVFLLPVQTLHVSIVNNHGQSIPNATVFMRETVHGMMADDRSELQTKLNAGDYTLDISSLGYESKTTSISVWRCGRFQRDEVRKCRYCCKFSIVEPDEEIKIVIFVFG